MASKAQSSSFEILKVLYSPLVISCGGGKETFEVLETNYIATPGGRQAFQSYEGTMVYGPADNTESDHELSHCLVAATVLRVWWG